MELNDHLSQPDGDNLFDTLASGSWTMSFYVKFITTTNQTVFWKGTYPSESHCGYNVARVDKCRLLEK